MFFVFFAVKYFSFLVCSLPYIHGWVTVLQIVKEAVAAGVDGYDAEIKKSVRKAAFGLRLTREVAISIASKAVSNQVRILFTIRMQLEHV